MREKERKREREGKKGEKKARLPRDLLHFLQETKEPRLLKDSTAVFKNSDFQGRPTSD